MSSVERVASRYLASFPGGPPTMRQMTMAAQGLAMVLVSDESTTVDDLASWLNQYMVAKHPGSPTSAPWLKGAVKAFSFHWSNAQHAWDVITVPRGDFPFSQDGSDFILLVTAQAISPIKGVWNLTEMKYVAKKLHAHPGAANAVRQGSSQTDRELLLMEVDP